MLLDELENQSIYILREAFNKFERLAMLWSIGKDFEPGTDIRIHPPLRS